MIEQIIEYVVKQLVDEPSKVRVKMSETDEGCIFEITVGESDRGKVIGRQGQTIKALRMLVSAIQRQARKVTVDVVTAV